MRSDLGLLLLGGLLFWGIAATLARVLGLPGADDAPASAGVAVLLCLLPSAVTLVWSRRAARSAPEMQLLALVGGTAFRMGFVLLVGLLLAAASPAFQQASFWIWLLLAYLFTLALEMLLLLRRQPDGRAQGLPAE